MKTNFVLTSLSSTKIRSLDDFINFFKTNCEESIYAQGVDFNIFAGKEANEGKNFNLSFTLMIYIDIYINHSN